MFLPNIQSYGCFWKQAFVSLPGDADEADSHLFLRDSSYKSRLGRLFGQPAAQTSKTLHCRRENPKMIIFQALGLWVCTELPEKTMNLNTRTGFQPLLCTRTRHEKHCWLVAHYLTSAAAVGTGGTTAAEIQVNPGVPGLNMWKVWRKNIFMWVLYKKCIILSDAYLY